MRYFKRLLCLYTVFAAFVLCSVEVHAEEYNNFHVGSRVSDWSSGSDGEWDFYFNGSNVDIVGYTFPSYDGNGVYYKDIYNVLIYRVDDDLASSFSLSTNAMYYNSDGSIDYENNEITESNFTGGYLSDGTNEVFLYADSQIADVWLGVDCDYMDSDELISDEFIYYIPMYSSRDAAINGILTGSEDGLLNKDPWECSKDKHNFKSDTIDTTIPLPIISNVSHEGFTIDNIEGTEYFVDVLVENRLFGVKHYQKPDVNNTVDMDVFSKSWDCIPDTSWEYATDYFNICASTDVAINHSVINLQNDYSVDNVGSLVSHFAQWSIDYPKRKNLPDYKWTMMSSLADSLYESKHTLQAVSDISSEQQLYNSGQASTSYYVRFYTKDNRTGQWVRYTYRDGYGTIYNGMIEDGTISSGVVDISPDGNVIVKDEVNGNVSEDGSIYYPVNDNTTATNFDSSLNGFMETLSGFSGVLGMFGGFMTSMFGWLPWWCSALIGAALVAVVVLRFLGR